jgi:hypothetical protein
MPTKSLQDPSLNFDLKICILQVVPTQVLFRFKIYVFRLELSPWSPLPTIAWGYS